MNSPDDIEWVRHVNERWLVRESLREDAATYLRHLAATDPGRLAETCRRARLLFGHHVPEEDPKPWFYAGLFSLATLAEAERFLSGHDFTIACIPALADSDFGSLHPGEVGLPTWEKILRIRAVLNRLEASEED